ncbi:hypothetical protein ACFL2Q_08860 [Thermodesulfobacteriota bacterium]
MSSYKAIFSSDWSECLSPNGPFDPISLNYPELESELSSIFIQYTGNRISLTQATARIGKILPAVLTKEQMDAFLHQEFRTYRGVPEFIQWCLDRDILFMINTTGTQGYFQRVFAGGYLPLVPVVAANPLIRYDDEQDSKRYAYQVLEIEDKPRCTRSVVQAWNMSGKRVFIMGDSGGDGPHFKWGSQANAFLIGSMTKHSLGSYCESAGIVINERFGLAYSQGQDRDPVGEMEIDFMDLTAVIENVLEP